MEIIFAILFILSVIWIARLIFEKLGFPLIVGELLAGMIIGPPILGIIGPQESVFTWNSTLDNFATLGMFFLMFYAGLAVNPRELIKKTKSFVGVGVLGTFAPLCLGFAVSWLFTHDFWASLFIGLAISGTSLVTKSKILDDLNILDTRLGHIMMGGGMVDNILSFIIISIAITTVTMGVISVSDILIKLILVIAFFSITLLIGYYVYPYLGIIFSRPGGRGFLLALIIGLIIAGVGDLMEIHFIIGAYLAGLFVREEIMLKTPTLGEHGMGPLSGLYSRFQTLALDIFGPIFIVSVAIKVSLGVIQTEFLFLLALIVVAVLSKVIGAGGGTYLTGSDKKEAFILGIGMNGRGTVELIIAMIGVEIGVLTGVHLSLLVLTAFATTLMVPIALKYLLIKWQ